jgi:Domain of unknown function (DUF4129)
MAGLAAGANGKGAWRTPLLIVTLLGLVGVVAIAATGRAPARGETTPGGHPPTLIVDYLSTIAVLFVPAGAILIVATSFMRRAGRVNQVEQGKRKRPIAGIVLLVLALAGIVYAQTHYGGRSVLRTPPTVETPTGTPANPRTGAKPDKPKPPEYEPRFRWLPVVVLGSLVLAFGGTAGVLLLRRGGQELPPRPMAAVLSEVLSETLDDLRNEPDPRRAVIRAYARMERTLAARGVPREPFEAPLEYLARILDLVQVSSHSVRRLTGLFERARFSPHEIDAQMKENAIESLVGIRAELEAGIA